MATSNTTIADTAKAEKTKSKKEKQKPKQKTSFKKGLKKVGPIRLVKGYRAPKLRPKIALDSQKDVADNVRKWLYERRNKYEKFVDNVLGKATPIATTPAKGTGSKQPVPGPTSQDPIGKIIIQT